MMGRVREYLVLSDTHGRGQLLYRVAAALNARPDAILFLGDGLRDLDTLSDIPYLRDIPVLAVSGNCDSFFSVRATEPLTRVVPLGTHTIYMTHGHQLGVRSSMDAAVQNAVAAGADVLLYGHTHVAEEHTVCYTRQDGSEGTLLVANPGSLGEPRDGGGYRFGVLTLTETDALFSHGMLSRY